MSKNKNKSITKPRYQHVTMEFTEPVCITSVKFDIGCIHLYSGDEMRVPKRIYYEMGISNEKKDKKTLVAPMNSADMNPYSILDDYDFVVAIDTSYCKGDAEAVTAASTWWISRLESDIREASGMVQIMIRYRRFRCDNPSEYAELYGLNSLIKHIRRGQFKPIQPSDRVLYIIDHHLDNLHAYNNRTMPLIIGDMESYIPMGSSLMYASVDKKNDSIFNQILAESDKVAGELRKFGEH